MTDFALDDVQLHLVDSTDEVAAFMRWLGERRPTLGVDTETGGLNWWRHDLRLVQFGDTRHGWAIPWHLWGGVAKEALEKYDGPITMHNMIFDVNFLEVNGVRLPRERIHDTMLKAHLIDPTQSVALKSLAGRHVDPRAGGSQQALHAAMRKQGWTWATVPTDFDVYWMYGALDAVVTAMLDAILDPIAQRWAYAYDIERSCALVLANMERRGVRIDVGYCAQKIEEADAWEAQAVAYLRDTWYIANPFSNPQVADALIRNGVQLTAKTPKGAWKLDEEVLKSIDHPITNTLLNLRKLDKKTASYFHNFLDLRDGDILHPRIKPVGARTARMSITEPALQTLPRGSIVRDGFIAREGGRLVLADYDQIEMRLFAHLCGDTDLQARFYDEVDFFTSIARDLYAAPDMLKKDPRRQLTKNATYALSYGAGAPKIAKTAGVPVEQVVEFLGRLQQRFPGIQQFQQKVDRVAKERYATEGVAYVTNAYGRRYTAEYDKTYRLVNYLIQGNAAYVLKMKLIELDAAGYGDWMVLPVHDEVVLDIPYEAGDEPIEMLPRVMEERQLFAVPLTVGVETVGRWGDKYRNDVDAIFSKQSGDDRAA